MRTFVYQLPYVQAICLFLMAALNASNDLEPGNLSPAHPYIYLTIVNLISFLFGMWGLFLFMRITHDYQLLVNYQYRRKALLLKSILVFINIQQTIIDALAKYEVINCVAPFISTSAMGAVVNNICCLVESLVLGTLCFLLYYTDITHL